MDNRPRIVPVWLVLLMAGVVLLTFYAVAPRGGLRERMASVGAPSDLSAAYLEAWLKVRPHDEEFLSILGAQYVTLGRLVDADRIARTMEALPSSRMQQSAMMLRLGIAQQRAFAMTEHDARRDAALEGLRAQIADAAKLDWSDRDLEWLAQHAAAVDAPALAQSFYTRLATQDAAHRDHWDTYIARYAMQVGDYRAAADTWFRRQVAATTLDEQRRCFIEGIRTLQSGNLLGEAIAVAGRQNAALIDDQATLVALLNLARAAQRPDLVEQYAKALARRVGIAGVRFEQQRGPRTHAAAGRVVMLPIAHQHVVARTPYAYMDGPLPDRAAWYVSGRTGERSGARVIRVALQTTPSNAEPPASAPTSSIPAAAGANTGDVADLLYQSFLESADPASAQKVAEAQLVKDPHAAIWKKRLAQVAEWNKAPALALKSWLDYAQQTGDPLGWQNVLRIAPMLDDDNAYLAALIYKARSTPGDLKLIDSVTATYERLGRPDDGIAFLKGLPRGAEADAIDERTGTLAERAGHDDDALAIYRRLQQRYPDNPTYALHTANLLYEKGDYPGALAAMQPASRVAKDSDVLFWRNYAELARLLQQNADAHRAYLHLLASGEATPDELGNMAYFYDAYPIDAGRLSELRYRHDHTPRALQESVYYYTDAGATERIDALLASLTPDELKAAEASPGFLGVRAEYERQTGRPLDALRDLQRASRLPGASADLDAALLWTLVDYGTDAELREALARTREAAQQTALLWGPSAAARMRLNEPVVALSYLRRQAALMSRDPLWLLTYADAQEMAGRTDLAWSIRHKVWLQMQQDSALPAAQAGARGASRTRASQDAETRVQLHDRRVALSSTFASADASAALLDALLKEEHDRQDVVRERRTLLGDARGLPPVPPSDGSALANNRRLREAVAREVAISWALSHEANPLAKRWLALQYANRLAQPAAEQLTLALADNDVGTMERLLAQGSRLPRYDRIDATIAVDQPAQAEALAFDGLDGAPDDTEMHRRLVETALTWPQSIDATVTSYVEHPLDYIEQTIAGSHKIAERYLVGVIGTQDFQHSVDATQLVNVPSVDRSVKVYAQRQTLDTSLMVSAGRREALDSFDTFALAAEIGRNSPLTLGVRAGRNQVADESPVLHVGGMKDNAIADLSYRMTPRLTMTGSVEADRFYSQARTYLGSGVLSSGQIAYKIHVDYPDYTLRLVGAHGDYSASGRADPLIASLLPAAQQPATAGNFMPATYSQYGLFFGFGNDLRDQYTHRWRPFLDVGIVHDSIQGWGPDISAGIAGTVFGGDHAALFIEHERVSRIGTPVTVVGARYSWFY